MPKRLVILVLILIGGGLQSVPAVAQLERSDWVLAADEGTGFVDTDGTVKDDSLVLLTESSLPCFEDQDVISCGHRSAQRQCYETYWYGGVELPMLQPSISSGTFTIRKENSYASPRIYFGREGASGAGFRGRFWGMGIDEDTVPFEQDAATKLHLDAGRFDIDLYRRFRFKKGDLMLGASVSAAVLELELETPIGDRYYEDNGGGVGFFVEGRHHFRETEKARWSLLTRGRWAYLVGERDVLVQGQVFKQTVDSDLDIQELFLGVEFKRRFKRSDLVLRYGMESQSWFGPHTGDVNFLGSTFSAGLEW